MSSAADLTALVGAALLQGGRGARDRAPARDAAHAPTLEAAVPDVLPFVVRPHSTPHTLKDGCDCDNCRRVRSTGFLKLLTPRQRARGKLASRAWRRDTGLSNPAYLAAPTGTQFLRVQVEPARVKFTFSDPLAESLTPLDGVGGKRGDITCLSEDSRERLANRAWSLSAEGHEPEIMVTLTSPANWERVYVCDEHGEALGGGRLLKAHLQAFRKRLERFLKRHGVTSWSALWFLEFQRRGAPHLHLMLFACKLPEPTRRALRNWCGSAWSSVVGNPDRLELGKHRRAGTQVARMKCKHFGYAVKYATKTEQKEVPHYFRDVGRFWGCWNYSSPEPLVLELDFSRLNKEEVLWVQKLLLLAIAPSLADSRSRVFAGNKLNKSMDALADGLKHKFGFTVFGSAGGEAVRSFCMA